MSYRSAQQILPEELIELIQQYVDGDFLYIPRKNEERRKWGEGTGVRSELEKRNTLIYEDYLRGMTMPGLAEKYFLSEKSIQRIVYQRRKHKTNRENGDI